MTIPKGVDNGVNLRMVKKGHQSLKGEDGDLFIKVNVKPHSYFKREGVNILTEKFITITQAVLGGNIKIETINGMMDYKLKPGTA